jgi:coenzyme F420-reducing hydrogenase alpha subunit
MIIIEMADKKQQAIQLFAVVGKMMNIMKEVNKCVITHCEKEKVAVMKDKKASSFNANALLDLKKKSKNEQDKQIKKWKNNKLMIALEKCQHNNCVKDTKNLMELIIDVASKTNDMENKKLTPEAEKIYKEFRHLLKLQKLSDKEYSRLTELNMRIVLV